MRRRAKEWADVMRVVDMRRTKHEQKEKGRKVVHR